MGKYLGPQRQTNKRQIDKFWIHGGCKICTGDLCWDYDEDDYVCFLCARTGKEIEREIKFRKTE